MDTQEHNKAIQEIADGINQLVADGKYGQAVAWWTACLTIDNAPLILALHGLVGDQLLVAMQKMNGRCFDQLEDGVVTHTHPNTYVREYLDAMDAAYNEMVSDCQDHLVTILGADGNGNRLREMPKGSAPWGAEPHPPILTNFNSNKRKI